MAEQPSRNRRIVRRAVVALAVVVLLLAWNVAVWLVLSRAHINAPLATTVGPVFAPLIEYCDWDVPGAGLLVRLARELGKAVR